MADVFRELGSSSSVQLQRLSFSGVGYATTEVSQIVAEYFSSLTELIIDVPFMFVPLVVQNKPFLTTIKLGTIPNEVVYIICSNLAGKKKFMNRHALLIIVQP